MLEVVGHVGPEPRVVLREEVGRHAGRHHVDVEVVGGAAHEPEVGVGPHLVHRRAPLEVLAGLGHDEAHARPRSPLVGLVNVIVSTRSGRSCRSYSAASDAAGVGRARMRRRVVDRLAVDPQIGRVRLEAGEDLGSVRGQASTTGNQRLYYCVNGHCVHRLTIETATTRHWRSSTGPLDDIPERLDGIDRQAMQLILLLHRVTNVVVYDLESRVHRPAGWSWSAFRAVFTLWISGPLEPSRLAETERHEPAGGLVARQDARGRRADRSARRPSTTPGRSCCRSRRRARGEITQVFRDHNHREADWAATLDPDERDT